jgi:hypothetical protein
VVMKAEIQEMLRRQHRNTAAFDAHPQSGFALPEWHSVISESGDSGNVPVWDL